MAARQIKKYANRKLYDLTDRRYVTLEAVAVMLRSGIDVEVVDQTSGEDITAATMSQALNRDPARRSQARTRPAAPLSRHEPLMQRLAAASLLLPLELGQRAVTALESVGRGARSAPAAGDDVIRAVESLRAELHDLRMEMGELREEVAVLRLVEDARR